MDMERAAAFARELYFDLQTIEGVKPLEIWSGFRDMRDPAEASSLAKNVYKIVVPLANERCYGRPFADHARTAARAAAEVIAWFSEEHGARIFERFPWPPTGDADQKALYRHVRARAAEVVAAEDLPSSPAGGAAAVPAPDGLFDFREMRLVDNELPYIIFTDKEFRVIHGMAIVYMWLIDLDALFLGTLEALGVDPALRAEYAAVARRARRESPPAAAAKRLEGDDLRGRILERLHEADYLDFFESVYAWYEKARQAGQG